MLSRILILLGLLLISAECARFVYVPIYTNIYCSCPVTARSNAVVSFPGRVVFVNAIITNSNGDTSWFIQVLDYINNTCAGEIVTVNTTIDNSYDQLNDLFRRGLNKSNLPIYDIRNINSFTNLAARNINNNSISGDTLWNGLIGTSVINAMVPDSSWTELQLDSRIECVRQSLSITFNSAGYKTSSLWLLLLIVMLIF
jgi:hypothetical protein